MKLYEARYIYQLLAGAHLTGMTAEQKYKVIDLMVEVKKPFMEFDEFIKDTREKVSDEKELTEILNKEASKDIELKFEKLGEVFDKLIEANDWTVNDISLLKELVK